MSRKLLSIYPLKTTLVFGLLFASAPLPAAGQETADVPPAIQEFSDEFVSATRSWDADRMAELFAEDGVMMAPSGRLIEGREAFRELWTRSFAGQSGRNPLTVTIHDVRVSGNLAVIRAGYGPEGAPDPMGHYVWVLERQGDGPWRLAWWIFNRRSG